jgi:hypothetical protein
MENQVPGEYKDAAKKTDGRAYKYQAFPKAVYGKTMQDCKIIKCEEERPDGYVDRKDWKEPTDKTSEAAIAKTEAKKAEKDLRKAIMDYLDEHSVDYAKNISTSKLEELKVALDAHLEKQEPSDDAE